MKHILMMTAAVLIATSVLPVDSCWIEQAQAQQSAAAPHKVGLIDMAYIFKNYKKFEVLREDLKQEIQRTDQQAQQTAKGIQQKQQQLKELEEGSAAYRNLEQQIAKMDSDFQTFRKVAQRDFLRKESQIYKTVYLEVSDAVTQYAKYYKYSLILRYNREALDQDDVKPEQIMQRMSRLVVYQSDQHQIDITDSILNHLNKTYISSTGGQRTPNKTAGN